jgi:hypothetical protein
VPIHLTEYVRFYLHAAMTSLRRFVLMISYSIRPLVYISLVYMENQWCTWSICSLKRFQRVNSVLIHLIEYAEFYLHAAMTSLRGFVR